MLTIRPSSQRGLTQYDWLNSRHTFSFADYYDPQFMACGHLRVINEDIISPQGGFGLHPHRNMEILTYVIDGALAHQDNLGNGSIIKPGDIQRMSAGTGIRHSEYNHSKDEPLHLLQIWVLPNQQDLPPSYEQKTIQTSVNDWILIASPTPHPHVVMIHQNLDLWVAYLSTGHTLDYDLKHHESWVQVIKGAMTINGKPVAAGDGIYITNEFKLFFDNVTTDAEILLFDMF